MQLQPGYVCTYVPRYNLNMYLARYYFYVMFICETKRANQKKRKETKRYDRRSKNLKFYFLCAFFYSEESKLMAGAIQAKASLSLLRLHGEALGNRRFWSRCLVRCAAAGPPPLAEPLKPSQGGSPTAESNSIGPTPMFLSPLFAALESIA